MCMIKYIFFGILAYWFFNSIISDNSSISHLSRRGQGYSLPIVITFIYYKKVGTAYCSSIVCAIFVKEDKRFFKNPLNRLRISLIPNIFDRSGRRKFCWFFSSLKQLTFSNIFYLICPNFDRIYHKIVKFFILF
jgi:hypothetical protein